MIGWFQLIMAVISLVREILKWLKERNLNVETVDIIDQVQGLKNAVTMARETRDNTEVENYFHRLG